MRELDLRMFDVEEHTVTVKFQSTHIEEAETDYPSYAKNDTVNIDVTYKTGYKLWRAVVFDEDNKFQVKNNLTGIKMGDSDMTVVLICTSTYDGEYFVREPVMIDINGKRTRIDPTQRLTINDGSVTISGGRTRKIDTSDAVTELIRQNILIPAKGEGSSFDVDIVK